MSVPERELKRTNNDKTAAIRTPTIIGCGFSIDREFFFEIGSYDEGKHFTNTITFTYTFVINFYSLLNFSKRNEYLGFGKLGNVSSSIANNCNTTENTQISKLLTIAGMAMRWINGSYTMLTCWSLISYIDLFV